MSGQQAEPAWDSALREFWASHLEDLRVSLPRHRAVMTVRVVKATERPDRRMVSWYELAFEGMTRFTFVDETGVGPWWTVELTAIGSREAEGRTEYGFDLTSIEDALLITCDEVRVTFLQQEEVPKSAVR